MTNHSHRHLSILLVVSMLLLSILVPGGPIEIRDFSHISPVILGLFNAFLTILGMGSLFVAYGVYRTRHWSYSLALACGISYLLVYLLDLAKIFPVSPTPMSLPLLVIECSGSIVALPVIVMSYKRLSKVQSILSGTNPYGETAAHKSIGLYVAASVIGIGIIIFATLSAMGR